MGTALVQPVLYRSLSTQLVQVENVNHKEGIMTYIPGSIALFHSKGFLGKLIRFGERIRGKKGTYWNHAGVIIDEAGNTVEALGHGVMNDELGTRDFTILNPADMSDLQRAKVVTFAKSCLGDHYGYLTIVSIGVDLVIRSRFSFRNGKSLICSELAARALEHGSWICPKLDTSHVMPSDLDKWLGK